MPGESLSSSYAEVTEAKEEAPILPFRDLVCKTKELPRAFICPLLKLSAGKVSAKHLSDACSATSEKTDAYFPSLSKIHCSQR